MFCLNCGAKNSEDAVFCEVCGTKLTDGHEDASARDRQNPFQNQQSDVQQRMEKQPGIFQQPLKQQEKNNQSGMFQQPPQQFSLQQPLAPGKPVSKLNIVIIVQILFLACIVYMAMKIGNNVFSPEHIAESYFVNIANSDWDSALEKADKADSDWLVEAQKFDSAENYNCLGEVVNYTLGDSGYNQDTGYSLGKDVVITYRTRGSQSDSYFTVSLVQNAKKKFLFFDNWNVEGNLNYQIATDYIIRVPQGAEVKVDGEQIAVLTEEQNQELYQDYYSEGSQLYYIAGIFYGTHELSVTQEGYQELIRTLDISGNARFYEVDSLQLSEEEQQKLMNAAEKAMKDVYSAAMSGQGFQTVSSLYSSMEEKREYIEENYKDLLRSLSDGNVLPYSIEFNNISAVIEDTSVAIEFDYNVKYTYEDWWSGNTLQDNYQGSEECYFNFVKENDSWVLENLGCTTLYYQ